MSDKQKDSSKKEVSVKKKNRPKGVAGGKKSGMSLLNTYARTWWASN